MLPVQIYFIILGLSTVYAMFLGGAPERIGAAIIAIGSVLSLEAVSGPIGRFASVEVGVFLVDVAALVAFLVLALRAERFWPLWVAAFQVIGTAGHAVKLVDPAVIPRAYAFILALWTYGMLLAVVLGTWNHRRRLARNGADPSWSTFSGRSATRRPPGPTAW